MKDELLRKLTSRKFWMAVAAFLASLGTGFTGLTTGNETLVTVGVICTTLSAAVYAAAEAYVDSKSVPQEQVIKNVTATATDKATVQQAFTTDAKNA